MKLVLLDGLVKINKKFQFECGDRCEAFLGNALDDFNLFDTFTLGSDSLLLGWQPQHAVSINEAKGRAMFNTTASLNSQYRLVDPSTLNTIKDDVHADSLFNIHAARTYIFNLDEKENYFYNQRQSGIKGVRLFEFNRYTDFLACFKHFNDGFEYLNRQLPSFETSTTMAKRDLNSTETKDEELNVFYNQIMDTLVARGHERLVKVRDKQGMKYHLSNMDLKPGKLYMLVLTGTAYEVQGGQRYWCEMVEADKNGKMKTTYQKWIQHKFFFFGTKEREEVAAMEWLRETKHLDPSTLPITITRTVLADMWFRNADRVSWQQILPSKKKMPKAFGYTDPLPDERPVDDSGTREGDSDRPSRGGQIEHTHTSPTEAANAAIYAMLRAKARSSVAEAASFLISIKKQDESLYSQLLNQLVEEMPEIKTQLLNRLMAAESANSLLNQLGSSLINEQSGSGTGNKTSRGGVSATLGGGSSGGTLGGGSSSSSSTGSSSTTTGNKSTVESSFSPKKRNK